VSASFLDEHLSRLNHRSDLVERAIYESQWKFVASSGGRKELYDLSSDPGELKNLYRPTDPVSRELDRKLTDWNQQLPRRKGKSAPMTDRQSLERLRSLGYVQ